jgi:hypothetical protein
MPLKLDNNKTKKGRLFLMILRRDVDMFFIESMVKNKTKKGRLFLMILRRDADMFFIESMVSTRDVDMFFIPPRQPFIFYFYFFLWELFRPPKLF